MANIAKGNATNSRRLRKGNRLRRTVVRAVGLLREDPVAIAESLKILGLMLKRNQITVRTIYEILNTPSSPGTLKSKLRDFSQGRISFDQLMEFITAIRKRIVPKAEIGRVLHCGEGKFYGEVLRLAMRHNSLPSFVTTFTIRRMKFLQKPAAEIEDAERLIWSIHQQVHKYYQAAAKVDKVAMKTRRGKIRKLQHLFIEQFTKKV